MEPASDENHLDTEQLYREHGRFVTRLLVRLGVPPDALDDTVQEVFLTVHRRGGYEFGRAKPTTYLATIACNAAASQRRVSRAQHTRRSERIPEELPSPCSDPLRVLETRRELHQLDRALARLDPALRSTLLRADGAGESCVEIANASEVPLGTVYWRLDRARKKLREAWSKTDTRRTPQKRLAMLVALVLPSKRAWRDWSLLGSKVLIAGAAAFSVLMTGSMVLRTPKQESGAAPSVAASHRETRVAQAAPLPAVHTVEPEKEAPKAPESVRVHTQHVPATRPTKAVTAQAPRRPEAKTMPAFPAVALPPPVSETEQLARAEKLLEEHPRDALALVRRLAASGTPSYLREERDYIELMALLGSGDRNVGRLRAQRFLHRYPSSAFAARVRVRAELP